MNHSLSPDLSSTIWCSTGLDSSAWSDTNSLLTLQLLKNQPIWREIIKVSALVTGSLLVDGFCGEGLTTGLWNFYVVCKQINKRWKYGTSGALNYGEKRQPAFVVVKNSTLESACLGLKPNTFLLAVCPCKSNLTSLFHNFLICTLYSLFTSWWPLTLSMSVSSDKGWVLFEWKDE